VIEPAVRVDSPVPPFATGRVPDTPVVSGSPVAFVSVTDVGVPNTGVTSVGLLLSTLLPDPVDVVTPVPPLATGNVPVTPVVSGNPVALVSVNEVGVPNAGVTSVGDVLNTTLPEPVVAVLTKFLLVSVNTALDAVSALGLTVPLSIVVLVPRVDPIVTLVAAPAAADAPMLIF
jgi:hypothetical protein